MTQIRFIVTVISLTIFSVFSIAQIPETNPNKLRTINWYFGDSTGIKLNNIDNPTLNSLLAIDEGSSVLSSSEGDLILYTDGIDVLNSNQNKLNSYPLRTFSSSIQTSIFVESDTLIYLLSTNPDTGLFMHTFRYENSVLVENTLNKKVSLTCSEALSSHFHQNNRGTFVTTLLVGSNKFQTSYFGRRGMICCPTFSSYPTVNNSQYCNIKYSPSNALMACSSLDDEINLFIPNKESGELTHLLYLEHYVPYSIEFSSNEKYLYVSSEGTTIDQYSLEPLDSDSIYNSKINVETHFNQDIGTLQLGPFGTILLPIFGSKYLGQINLPNNNGSSNGVNLNQYFLGNHAKSKYGLPNFNASYFYTPSIDFAYTEDCWSHDYSFEGRDTFDADGYKWIFEKVNSSELSVISGKNCVFTFPDTGKWKVSHIAWNTSRSDTVTKTLTIRPKWEQNMLGKDTFYCKGDSKGIVLTAPSDMHCVHWNGEEPNLDSALGKIIDYDHFHTDTLLVDTAGTYIVKLTNKTFCQAWDTITISEYPTPSKSGISRFKDSIVSNTVAQTYRWYRDGVPQLETDDRRLKPDSNGTWQVQLVSEFGCDSELSDSLLVGFASIPSIKATNPLSFKVYPNPSDGNITIAVPKGGDYQVLIYDMTGKLIYNTSQSLSLLFELELELVSGTYLLTLSDEDGNVGTKQVVVK
jgi:hypothetical protein